MPRSRTGRTREQRVREGSLAVKRPHLIPLWDTERNGDLTPDKVLNRSHVVDVHWKCPQGPDHEFVRPPARVSGCPFCKGLSASATNNLSAQHPDVAVEWHPFRNGHRTPADVAPRSNRVVWWQCPSAGHEYQMKVEERTRSEPRRCPQCIQYEKAERACNRRPKVSREERLRTGSLAAKRPELIPLWDVELNGDLTPDMVMNKSGAVRVHWSCPEGPDHRFTKTPAAMFGCPYCLRRLPSMTNCLAAEHPEVAAEWHPTKNGDLTPKDVLPGTAAQVWWACPDGHAYRMPVQARTGPKPRRCTECIRVEGVRLPGQRRSLRSRFPVVADLWHPTRNGDLTPDTVDCLDERVVWWCCPRDERHEWEADIKRSARKVPPACPFCAGRRALFQDSLAGLAPELAQQWHKTKNGDLTPDAVPALSHRPAWWQCPVAPDHEWKTPVRRRYESQSGCLACLNLQVSVTNRLDLRFPEVASQWHPTRNGDLTPDRLVYGSGRMCWWLCAECGNEWKATPERRTVLLTSCRRCNIYNTSKNETFLAYELSAFVGVDFTTSTVRDAKRKAWQVDILVPEHRLIVEFDGAFWHAAKADMDREKTLSLMAAGWTVLRLRERPLPDLDGVWCVAGRPEAHQRNAAAVLLALVEAGYPLDAAEIKAYARRNRLVRGEEARAAIAARNAKRIRRVPGGGLAAA